MTNKRPTPPPKPTRTIYKEVKKLRIDFRLLKNSGIQILIGVCSYGLLRILVNSGMNSGIIGFILLPLSGLSILGCIMSFGIFSIQRELRHVNKKESVFLKELKQYDKAYKEYEINLKDYENSRKKNSDKSRQTEAERIAKEAKKKKELLKKQLDETERRDKLRRQGEESKKRKELLKKQLDETEQRDKLRREEEEKKKKELLKKQLEEEKRKNRIRRAVEEAELKNKARRAAEDAIKQQEQSKKALEDIKRRNEKLNEYQIEFLYHMTHVSNLENIFKSGLLSHNEAHRGLNKKDIADNEVNNRRNRLEPIYNRRIHDYVPLYFNPKNPMLFRRKNIQKDIVILAIERSILFNDNVLFTDGNAASQSTKFFTSIDNLNQLNWQCIQNEYWNDYQDGKRIKCAEVLYYPKIEISLIKKIYCYNQITLNNVKSKNKIVNNIDVEININMYFRNHNMLYTESYYEPNDDLPF